MAFQFEILDKTVFGNKRVVFGWYENDGGSTGGEIATELDRLLYISLTPINGSAATAIIDATAYSSPEDIVDPNVTILTTANSAGLFMAVGL